MDISIWTHLSHQMGANSILQHLTEYGQSIADAQALAVDYINIEIRRLSELLTVDRTTALRACSRLGTDQLGHEIEAIVELVERLTGNPTRPITEWVDDINHLEALVQKICSRFDLEVDDFLRAAAELRAAGTLFDDDARGAKAAEMYRLRQKAPLGEHIDKTIPDDESQRSFRVRDKRIRYDSGSF